jgi:RNA polymerase sigma-70 factor, ECF subfamily
VHDIDALYREHRAGLVRLVERELHDRHDAEDVVQTAFIDAQRALERGTIPHNPRAWLAAIALNAARRLRRRHVSVEVLEDYAVQEASRLPEIKAALAGVPKKERAAVLYCDVLGLSYAEIAVRMGMTVPAVTMLLHRARMRLRSVLGIAVVGVGAGWRWLRSSPYQAAAAKAAAVVVVAGGLTTAGVVTAQHAARATDEPAAAGLTTTAAAPSAGPEPADIAKKRISLTRGSARRAQRTAAAGDSPTPAAAQTASQAASALPSRSTTAAPVASVSGAHPPAVSVPSLSVPGATVSSTSAAVTTPVAAVTAPLPPGTTISVPTPIGTVTVSIP